MKRKVLKISIIIVIIFAILFSGSLLVIKTIYDNQFNRFDRPDYNLTAGISYSEENESQYPRETFSFASGKNKLAGYLYGLENDKALIVMAHGIGGGADSYLAETMFFVDCGFRVFAFDCTGSYDSEGESTKGFPQALLDLDAALTFIENDDSLNTLKVCLFGHSWGGYAVANVLNYQHDITAVVSVAGVNTADEFIADQAVDILGFFGKIQRPIISLYQQMLFGEVVKFDAVQGINKSNIPVFIIHGENDDTVSYERDSIIGQATKITNPYVKYLTTTNDHGGHNNLFKSIESLTYIKLVNEEYLVLYNKYNGEIPYDEQIAFYDKLDDALISELNQELMNEIVTFYNQAIESN